MKIDLVVAASPLRLQSDRCWRLGMIVYELITNAARHAFANGSGQVRVELWRARKFVECSVTDDGSAPADVQRGRGLTIVHELIKSRWTYLPGVRTHGLALDIDLPVQRRTATKARSRGKRLCGCRQSDIAGGRRTRPPPAARLSN
jgi:two-component sensor histidine kinase